MLPSKAASLAPPSNLGVAFGAGLDSRKGSSEIGVCFTYHQPPGKREVVVGGSLDPDARTKSVAETTGVG